MNTQPTAFDILLQCLENEIGHAQSNDHRLPADMANPKGRPAVAISYLLAAIEGAKRRVAQLPKEVTYSMNGCVFIGKNKDGSNPVQTSSSGSPPIHKVEKVVMDGWVLIGPLGAEDILAKIAPDVSNSIVEAITSPTSIRIG